MNKTLLNVGEGYKRRLYEKPSGTQATATATYPGAFLPFSAASPGTFLHQNGSTPGTNAPLNTRPVFAVEKTELGQDLSSPTTPGDTVRAYHPLPGEELYVLVATGATYAPGGLLKPQAGATYGALAKLGATGATASVVGICMSTIATASTVFATNKVKMEVL